MKASRDQLKALMKELLIEILSEGLGNVSNAARPVPMGRSPTGKVGTVVSNGRKKPEFDSRLDTPVGGGRTPTDALKEAVKREAGGNPIMAAILADTAMTTLPTQLGAGDAMGMPMPGGGMAPGSAPQMSQREQFHGEVSEVFGDGGQMRDDGSSHWADLAFMTSKKLA
jgi:hypothetical protein